MLNLPKKLKSYRILIQNFTSLSLLQIANYLFPLIVLPYVVRVLGPANYGLVNFAAAFIAYFNLLCDYGFSLSGTKEISVIRDDKEKLSKAFSTIIVIKFLLSIVSFLFFIVIIYFIPFFKNNWEVYILSYGFVIGGVLFPGWFYQGMEKMKYITIIQVFIRSIATVLIFILIKEETDYLLLVLLNSVAQILIGIIGLVFVRINFHVKFSVPSVADIKLQLKSGWNVFMSIISINLYTTSNTFILGLFASEAVVGYYAAADKIRLAFQGIQSVLSQTVFPHINKLLSESYDKFITFNKNLLKYQTIVSVLISLILFLFAEKIVLLLLGQQFSESIYVLKILAILPFFSSFTSIFAINMLIPLDQKNDFMKTFLAAGIIGLISALVLIPVYQQNGTAIAIVLAELTAASLSFWYVKRKLKISG